MQRKYLAWHCLLNQTLASKRKHWRWQQTFAKWKQLSPSQQKMPLFGLVLPGPKTASSEDAPNFRQAAGREDVQKSIVPTAPASLRGELCVQDGCVPLSRACQWEEAEAGERWEGEKAGRVTERQAGRRSCAESA